MNPYRLIFACSIIALLLGCQTSKAPIKVSTKRAETSQAPTAAKANHDKPMHEDAMPHEPIASPEPVIAPETDAPSFQSSPAALALLQEAEISRNKGDIANASATLERAVHIQPRNPLVWQQLAEIRLLQHQPEASEDLAKKSNTLALGNKAFIRKNWQLIAEARRQKNDLEGALDADFKAHE